MTSPGAPTTPAVTAVRLSGAAQRAALPLLVLGPALGTGASDLWRACAASLVDAFDVLAWDLPGHGHNRGVPDEPVATADVARGVLAVVDDVLVQRGDAGGSFDHVGLGLGGEVGLQLLLDAPGRVRSAVLLHPTSPPPPSPAWLEAGPDVRERMGEAGAAALDVPEPADPVADPDRVAALVRSHLLGEEGPRDLAGLVARHRWQPAGLDPRAHELVALAALVVAGDPDGVAARVVAARAAGVLDDEVVSCVVQAAAHTDLATAAAALQAAADVLGGGPPVS